MLALLKLASVKGTRSIEMTIRRTEGLDTTLSDRDDLLQLSPLERLAIVERLRQVTYGNGPTPRLQRIAPLLRRKQG